MKKKWSAFYALSGRMKRQAKIHLAEIAKFNRTHPQKGIITFGGGVNVETMRREAETQGFHTALTPFGVTLQ